MTTKDEVKMISIERRFHDVPSVVVTARQLPFTDHASVLLENADPDTT